MRRATLSTTIVSGSFLQRGTRNNNPKVLTIFLLGDKLALPWPKAILIESTKPRIT